MTSQLIHRQADRQAGEAKIWIPGEVTTQVPLLTGVSRCDTYACLLFSFQVSTQIAIGQKQTFSVDLKGHYIDIWYDVTLMAQYVIEQNSKG